MFTTSGYFRGICCPFFLSGLCERPYCHFRHAKSDLGPKGKNSVTSASDSYLDSITDLSYSGPSASRSLNQIECDIKKEKICLLETESQHGSITYSEKKLTGKPQEHPVKILTEKPEEHPVKIVTEKPEEHPVKILTEKPEEHPVKILTEKPQEQAAKINRYTGKAIYSSDEPKTIKSFELNKYTGKPIVHIAGSTSTSESSGTVEKYSSSENIIEYAGEQQHEHSVSNIVDNSMGSIPEYNPTPICELKKRHVGSRKYSSSLAETPLFEQEYDPLVNYATSFNTGSKKMVDLESNMKKSHTYHGELSYSDFDHHSSLRYKMADFGFSDSEEEDEGGKWPYYKNALDDLDEKNFDEKTVTFALGDSDSDGEHDLMIAESGGKETDSDASNIVSPLNKPADSNDVKNISVKNSEKTSQKKQGKATERRDEILKNGMKNNSDFKASSTNDICNGDISDKVIKYEPVLVENNDDNGSKASNDSDHSFSLLSLMSQNMKSLTKSSSREGLVKTGSRVTLMKLNSVEHSKATDSTRKENKTTKCSAFKENVVQNKSNKDSENIQNSTLDASVNCTVNFNARTKSHSSASCDSRRSSNNSDRSKPESSKLSKSHRSNSEKSSNKTKTHSEKSSHSGKTKSQNVKTKDSEKSSKDKKNVFSKSHTCKQSENLSKSHDEKAKSQKESSVISHSHKLLKSHTKDSLKNQSSKSHMNGSSNINLHKDKSLIPHNDEFRTAHENVSKDDLITSSSSRLGKSQNSEKQKTRDSSKDGKDGHSKVKYIHRHSDKQSKVTSPNKSEHSKHSAESKNKFSISSKNKLSEHTRHRHDHSDSSRKRKIYSTDNDPLPKLAKKTQDNLDDVIMVNSSPDKDSITQRGSVKKVPLSKSPSKAITDLFGEDSDDGGSDGRVKNFSDMSDSELCQYLSDDDFEDMNTYDECLRIFNEGPAKLPSSKFALERKVNPVNPVDDLPSVTGKKRVAHYTSVETKKKVPEKPFNRLSAAQVMHNRFAELHRREQEAANMKPLTANSSHGSASLAGKKRIAHQQTGLKGAAQAKKKTISITASKTERRVAHKPTVNLKRPTIPTEFGSKVPSVIRQRYLNTIIDDCLKICGTTEEAFKRGQEEEMAVYNRSSSKTVYLNVAVNTIKRLRTEAGGACPQSAKQKNLSPMKVSHEAVLGGKGAAVTSFTLNRSGGTSKVQPEDFKGADLFNRLKPYILTETQLQENGFPRPSAELGGFAVFCTDKMKAKQNTESNFTDSPGSKQRVCVRCGSRFTVFPSGRYAKVEECVFHWGKAWKKRVDRSVESRYNCCEGDLDSKGCQTSKGHVHESNKIENLKGYMKTIPSSPPIDGDYGVYAMDCEMVYTTAGLELARVTVVGSVLEPIYESFVKPNSPVVDYNTRFSGITEKDLIGVKTTLHDVQAVLLSLFTAESILLGHSLESDFVTVKLIHDTVVDTSVVFPHRLGPPYKRALRNLMSEFMKKIIQDDVGGHDSLEDARACLELMQWKLKEDFRKRFY